MSDSNDVRDEDELLEDEILNSDIGGGDDETASAPGDADDDVDGQHPDSGGDLAESNHDPESEDATDCSSSDPTAEPAFEPTTEPWVFDPHELASMTVDVAITSILDHAADLRASDVFFMTDDGSLTVSVRRLGAVHRVAAVPAHQGRQYISYLKTLAGMDISEHRRPMDGRWIFESEDHRLDMRINTIATLRGEDMTLRLWDRNQKLLSIDDLGMAPHDKNKLLSMLTHPAGLLLVTGPTGTGKTTTLYACIEYLNDGTRKINTLEDPVEYALPGIRQSQVNPKIGLEFSDLLRNVLRQAPDVIMVGEIRDEETAATAVRAANSGHLVLATLHAPVAAGAVQSMLALGAHPYFLSSCLLGVVAQRLVRTLCPDCRISFDFSEAPEAFSEIQPLLSPGEGQLIWGPAGCDECFQVGYAGRTGIFEIISIKQELRRLIAGSRPTNEIQQAAIRGGMIEFRRAALLKVAQGVTATEEILRDVPAEHLGLEE